MPIDTGANQNLNRAEILAAIDYEIESIEKARTSPGWTKWTFCGGFATLVWISFAEAEKKTFTPANIALVFILCSIAADLIEFILGMVEPKTSRPSVVNRFRLSSHELAGSRLNFLGIGLRLAVLLAIYCFLSNSNLNFHSKCFAWYYSIILFFVLIILALSYVGYPINLKKGSIWSKSIFSIVVISILSTALFAAETKLYANTLTFSDLRLGFLAATFLWLVPIALSHVSQNQPLLDTLKNVRRDFAFNRINIDTAFRQADIALDGMRVEDYLQPDLQKVLERMDSASKSMRDLQDRLKEAEAIVHTLEQLPAENILADLPSVKMLRVVLESCDLHRGKILEMLNASEKVQQIYLKKKLRLVRVVEKAEIDKIEFGLKSFFGKLNEQNKELSTQQIVFIQRLGKLREKSPLLPHMVA